MKKEISVNMHKLLDRLSSSSNSVKYLFKWTNEACETIAHLIKTEMDDNVCDNIISYYNKRLDIIDKFIKELE